MSFEKAFNFWKEIDRTAFQPAAKEVKQPPKKSEHKSTGKVQEKIREYMAKSGQIESKRESETTKRLKPMSSKEEGKGAKRAGKITIPELFQSTPTQSRQLFPARSGDVIIPPAFLVDAVSTQKSRKDKGKEKEEAKEKRVPFDPSEFNNLKGMVDEDFKVNFKHCVSHLKECLSHNPDAAEWKAMDEGLQQLGVILKEHPFPMSMKTPMILALGDLKKLLIKNEPQSLEKEESISHNLESSSGRLAVRKEILIGWRNEWDALTQYDETKATVSELGAQLERLNRYKKNMATHLKSNYPEFYGELEKEVNGKLELIQNKLKEHVLDVRSIEEEAKRLAAFLNERGMYANPEKISRRKLTELNLTHSYTVYPNGKICVHLTKNETAIIQDEVKQAKLVKGGYKFPKLMRNIGTKEYGEYEVRGISLRRFNPKVRRNILAFMKDIEGDPHFCQVKYMSWKSAKPKTAEKGVEREAFVSTYYPYTAKSYLSPEDPRQLPKELDLTVALQTAEGVEVMHGKNWVHCDIKPDNIFIKWDPANPKVIKAVLGDFDTVKKNGDPTQVTGLTGGYYPADMFLSADVIGESAMDERRADIYGLGVSWYEMFISHGPAPWKLGVNPIDLIYMTNRPEYKEMIKELKEKATTPFEVLILEMCEPDPRDRPDIQQVIKRLKDMQA